MDDFYMEVWNAEAECGMAKRRVGSSSGFPDTPITPPDGGAPVSTQEALRRAGAHARQAELWLQRIRHTLAQK